MNATREQVLVDKDKLEKLIDRQTPKWVNIIKINTDDWPEYEYYCPRCNGFLNCYLSDPYKYCPNCGQAIRWGFKKVVEVQSNGKSYNDERKAKSGGLYDARKETPRVVH